MIVAMFLFLRLLLAHFIADFPFQTTGVYILKEGSGIGKYAHIAVVFGFSVFFAYPYWGYMDIWIYLIGAALIHHLADWIKVKRNQSGSTKKFLFRYLADQVIHLATVAFVLLMPVSRERLEWPGTGIWSRLYNSDDCMLYGSLLIVATYFATYFIETFKQAYFPAQANETLPATYKYYGLLERTCLFNLAFLGGFAWIVAPISLLPRFIMANSWPHIFRDKVRCTSLLEVSLSFILGVIPGIILRYTLPWL